MEVIGKSLLYNLGGKETETGYTDVLKTFRGGREGRKGREGRQEGRGGEGEGEREESG